MSDWFVYMVRCADNSLYTGIATDLARRVAQHNGTEGLGARYTRSRRPVELVFCEKSVSRSAASQRERQIKQLSKTAKEALTRGYTDLG